MIYSFEKKCPCLSDYGLTIDLIHCDVCISVITSEIKRIVCFVEGLKNDICFRQEMLLCVLFGKVKLKILAVDIFELPLARIIV